MKLAIMTFSWNLLWCVLFCKISSQDFVIAGEKINFMFARIFFKIIIFKIIFSNLLEKIYLINIFIIIFC